MSCFFRLALCWSVTCFLVLPSSDDEHNNLLGTDTQVLTIALFLKAGGLSGHFTSDGGNADKWQN